MELYKILTARRKAIGMSLDALSDASGVPKSTLAKIMSGATKSPEFERIRAIADALGLSLEDLSDKKRPANDGGPSDSISPFYDVLQALDPDYQHVLLVFAKALVQDQAERSAPRD